MMKKGFCILMATGAAAFAIPCTQADAPSTYTRQARAERLADKLSVTYAIEVIHDGKVSNVPSNYAFHKGDDVRFHVQSNTDGFMYILASGADRGSFDVIYPPTGVKETGIQKGKDYHLPHDGMKLKSASVMKSVKLVFSKTRLDTDMPRRMSFPGLVDKTPSLANTVTGTPETAKPETFSNEEATTIVLTNSTKPLGMEIMLSSQLLSSHKSKQ